MDAHDVSDAPEFVKMLMKQKKSLRAAQSRRGQRPGRKRASDELVMEFMFRLMMRPARFDTGFTMHSSFIPPSYPPCISILRGLNKIMIKDLVLETHHRGTHILLRTVTPQDRMTAVMAIVEDENADATMLQLYYQESEKERTVDEILRRGTVLIVKEPYFKLMSDGNYGIRFDHLSDVIRLPLHDERVPVCWKPRFEELDVPVDVWKVMGNDHFNASMFPAAIECYTKALTCSPTDDEFHTLKLNRSLAFLKTKQFDAALADLDFASTTRTLGEKALYRRAQALYGLQRYRECSASLKDLCLRYPNNLAAKSELGRAISRLAEQERGKYDFLQLYGEVTKILPPHLDHSTYLGPVSVRASGSRGRGLFTTKGVKAGELLLCEKAFAHAFVDDGHDEDVAILIRTENDNVTMGSQGELIRLIVQKLYRNPSLASAITDLHHGSYKPVRISEADGTPVVDTFLVERVVSLNCFGCPLSTRELHVKCEKEEIKSKSEARTRWFHSCGVWPTASYINHCCYGNARRAFIGDMMVVRATQDLEPDTEITFWYQVPVAESYDNRQKKLRHWGFKCDCKMCQDDQTTSKSVLTRRKNLRADVLNHFHSSLIPNGDKIEAIINGIAKTYRRPASEVPRLSLWDPQLALAHMYMEQMQPIKAIDAALRVLQSLGYIIEGGNMPRPTRTPIVIKKWGLMLDQLIECWILLANAYSLVAPDLEAQADEYARISYKICIGEAETFNKTYEMFSSRSSVDPK